MTYDDNKFTISNEESDLISNKVEEVLNTFPSNISKIIIDEIDSELTGLYILTVCNQFLKTLPSGTGGSVYLRNTDFSIIKLEEDLLISAL